MKKAFTLAFPVSIFFLFPLVFQQVPVSAQMPFSGEEIFMQGRCARCHTLGRGRFVGPDLLSAGERYSRDDLVKWARDPGIIYAEKKKKPVNEGYPPMPPMNLSESDAQKIADYLLNYSHPSGLSESGTIKGQVSNVTTAKPEVGQDVVLISYMGERQQDRSFAKADSLGNFSFPSLRWDRSYEIVIFRRGVQYVSGKMIFPPGEDEITLDLPVYDTTASDEHISLRSLNVIIYPDDEGENVSVTSIYGFENSGDTVFTGEQEGSGMKTLVFSVPEGAGNISFSDGSSAAAMQREGEKLYSGLPFLPGGRRVSLGYSLPVSRIRGEFRMGIDYEVEFLAVFVRKTGPGVQLEHPEALREEVIISDEEFFRYEIPNLKPGSLKVSVSGASFFKSDLGKYLPVMLFFVFAATGVICFFYGKNRFRI